MLSMFLRYVLRHYNFSGRPTAKKKLKLLLAINLVGTKAKIPTFLGVGVANAAAFSGKNRTTKLPGLGKTQNPQSIDLFDFCISDWDIIRSVRA